MAHARPSPGNWGRGRARPICPALTKYRRARTGTDRAGFPQGLVRKALQGAARHFRRIWKAVSENHSKTDVVVPVVRIVPVPVSAPHVPCIVVERPAAQNGGCFRSVPIKHGLLFSSLCGLPCDPLPSPQDPSDFRHQVCRMLVLAR